jgi:hypothetical protein
MWSIDRRDLATFLGICLALVAAALILVELAGPAKYSAESNQACKDYGLLGRELVECMHREGIYEEDGPWRD